MIITIAGNLAAMPEPFFYEKDGEKKRAFRILVKEGYGNNANLFEVAVFSDRLVEIAAHLDEKDPVRVEAELYSNAYQAGGKTTKYLLNLKARYLQCLDNERFSARWEMTHPQQKKKMPEDVPKHNPVWKTSSKASENISRTESQYEEEEKGFSSLLDKEDEESFEKKTSEKSEFEKAMELLDQLEF